MQFFVSGELLKELISETTMYQSYDYKNIVAEMYHKVVLGADDCLNFLEQHSDILDNDIIMGKYCFISEFISSNYILLILSGR